MKGQVLFTFDDGTAIHLAAAKALADRELQATFGVVTDKVGTPGFLDHEDLSDMSDNGHTIASHGAAHAWLGGQPEKDITPSGPEGVIEDVIEGRDAVNSWGYDGDFLLVPFGTPNVGGPDHLREYVDHFRWIRMTVGTPLPEKFGNWTILGGKRLYPANYAEKIIGITAAADVRHPERTMDVVQWAADLGRLAVICYHNVAHHHGSGQDITWEQFQQEIGFVGEMVEGGYIDCVSPADLIGRGDDD